MLHKEQKGYPRKYRGTKDQVLINKMSFQGVGMTWIDYIKAFDIVPHSWLKKCMMMSGVAENMQKVLVNTMKK